MIRTLPALSALLLLSACGQAIAPASPELAAVNGWCFSGGTIYTADDAQPTADAVAVIGNKITYVGADEGDWCPEQAVPYDLNGYTLYPGLTDAHAHLIGIGKREMELDLTSAKSVLGLQDLVRAVVITTPVGETVFGDGWIETHWPEGRFPTRQDLDAVSTDHPIILQRADGHAAVANSLALSMSKIDGSTEAPFGGAINLDTEGNPTGMLIDNAQRLVFGLMPAMDAETRSRAFKLGSDVYASRGWTNIHSMSVMHSNVDMINQMANDGDISIRVYNSLGLPESGPSDKVAAMAGGLSGDAPHVTTRAIKLYADGALGSRGAALLLPYSDDLNNSGLMTLERDRAIPIFEAALRNGIQVNTHAIGDKGNQETLNWYEEAFNNVPKSEWAVQEPRWRIEHSQILDPSDISRFKSLGVIPSMQPSHAIGDLHFAVDRLSTDRLEGAYAWRALIDSGVIVAGGSDAPVEVGDPRIELHAAIQRTDLDGYSNENWGLDQRVAPQEALKMFTLWPAHAAFQENELGSIEVGKLADFSVFDKDMLDPAVEPMDANPVMTMVDGNVIWSR
ncbi:amidohydrolase [Algimonas arctica]|uniref:Amidohydrolase n=1 Tax=Algimonas arctica TaxID=1479486 RepID=A0A8J3CPG9_9PROT|nr:amidohydrolase [Algimonas arctica]GHA90458.1 amidohydrolase [Algimonas arctica]